MCHREGGTGVSYREGNWCVILIYRGRSYSRSWREDLKSIKKG